MFQAASVRPVAKLQPYYCKCGLYLLPSVVGRRKQCQIYLLTSYYSYGACNFT